MVQSAVFAGTIDAEELKAAIRYKISISPVVASFTMPSLVCKLFKKNFWTRNCLVEVFCHTNLVANCPLQSGRTQVGFEPKKEVTLIYMPQLPFLYSSFLPFCFADFDYSNYTNE